MPNAIDNTNMLNYRDVGIGGFTPRVAYDVDSNAGEIDFTDTTSWPAGIALKKGIAHVYDKFGGEVRGAWGQATGSDSGNQTETTVDISDLDLSKPLDIKVTLIGDDDKLVADGIATNIGVTGTVGSWDRQSNAATSLS